MHRCIVFWWKIAILCSFFFAGVVSPLKSPRWNQNHRFFKIGMVFILLQMFVHEIENLKFVAFFPKDNEKESFFEITGIQFFQFWKRSWQRWKVILEEKPSLKFFLMILSQRASLIPQTSSYTSTVVRPALVFGVVMVNLVWSFSKKMLFSYLCFLFWNGNKIGKTYMCIFNSPEDVFEIQCSTNHGCFARWPCPMCSKLF
jgi:hypothetical protein